MKFKKLLFTSVFALLPMFNASAITTERVSLGPVSGDPLNDNGGDELPSVSSDGRYVAFQSDASDIVTGDTNSVRDVFVRDRTLGTNTRVSVATGGTQATGGNSVDPDISNDGRYIVFASAATNLTSDTDTNGTLDIFLHDRNTGSTTLISKAGGTAGSTSASNGRSNKPVIAGNGRYIAYESTGSDIHGSDTDAQSDIFVYDIATGMTGLVSVNTAGTGSGNGRSLEADISDTGQFIAFASDATNLTSLADGAARDVFLRDIISGVTTAVTSGSPNVSGLTDSQQPVISADGNLIVFESYRQNLVADDNNLAQDVYIYNRSRDEYRRVSISSLGAQGDARSGHPGVSSDGRYVIFESSATNLVSGDTNAVLDVFVHDLQLAKTNRISVSSADAQGTGASQKPRISRDGNFAVYSSTSAFVGTDTNSNEDIYISTLDIVVTPTLTDPHDPTDILETFSDFNGDGRSDILWRNESNGEMWIYLMNGKTILAQAFVIAVPDLNWKIVGVGDFDGDAKDDVLWRNSVTGENYVLLMNGVGIKSQGSLSTVDTSWKVSGIGDFDNDNKFDVFWSNTVTGEHGMYLMNGIGIKSISSLVTAGLEWKVGGIGDYDNDGKSDIIWSNTISGEHYIFLMNGTVQASGGPLVTAGLEWSVAGVGDYNNDGKSDTLWRNSNSGQYWMLLMNGIGFTTSQSLLTVPSLTWELKQIGDFDGDLKSDTVWRNNTSGINWQVLLDGVNQKTSQEINTISDLNWKIKGQQE